MPSTTSSGSPGYIEALEVTDFKSYKGTHYIGPFREFTCIIGPNGSGKSNIMDAVSFVLGIKSASMRAQNLKELVYNVDTGKAKKAIVKLYFAVSGSKKVIFQRTVDSDGVTQYAVDGKVVTWTKYEEVLRSFNILAGTRNCLIFQGEVESMAHKSPKELTEMIETVAGSAELKKEYEARRKEYQQATELLRQTSKNKNRTTAEQRIMKLHKDEAEKYRSYLNDLSLLKTEHAMLQFYHIETGLVSTKKFMQVAQDGVSKTEKGFTAVDKDVKKVKQEIANLHQQHLKYHKQEKEITQSLMAKKRTSAELGAQAKTLEAKIQRVKMQHETAKTESKNANKRLEALDVDVREQELIIANFEKEWQEEDKKGTLSDKDIAEFQKLRETAQVQTSGLHQELKTFERSLEHTVSQINSLHDVKRDNEKRLAMAQEKVIEYDKRHEDVKGQRTDVSEQNTEWQSELLQVKGDIERKKQALATNEVKLKQISEEVASMRTDRDESKSSLRMKQALEDMAELFSGVKGRLCDLISIPNKKHKIAVTVALGKNMESIVTDTDRTAHECVQYLKDQRIGTCNFIPLSSVRGKEVTDQHRVLGGSAKPVADCVVFEPWLAPAIRYSIGQTILVNDITEGQQVAWEKASRHKVVTLDGTVLQKNGVMTGGAASIEKRAQKFDEKTLDSKKDERDKLAIEVRSLHTEILRAEEKERDLNTQVMLQEQKAKIAEADAAQWLAKKKEAEAECKSLEAEKKSYAPQLASLEKQKVELEGKVSSIQAKITAEESKIFGDFGKRVNIRDIRDFERKELNKEKDRAAKRTEIRSVINRLKAQIDFEQKREQPVKPEELAKQAAKLAEEFEEKKKLNQTRAKEESELEKQLETVKSDIAENTKKLREAEASMKVLKKDLSVKTAEIETARKKKQQLLSLQEKLRSQRANLYVKCVAEDIKLPVISSVDAKRKREPGEGDGKSNKGGPGKHVEAEYESMTDAEGYVTVSEVFTSHHDPFGDSAGTKKPTTTDVGKQAGQHLLGIDFTSMKETQRAAVRKGKQPYMEQLALLDNEIERKLDAIDALSPNMKVDVEKLKGVEGEMKKQQTSWLEAQEAQKKASMAFMKVKEKRYNKFTKAFETISGAVTTIYEMLTQDTRGDKKGAAWIMHDELDEPYLSGTRFSAAPPNKRFREMEQLSGGEKTVAALALLFAIHKVCPSPFFVLDEVDAALDKSNVDKVIHYVLQSCSSTQFLVISLKDTFYRTASSLVGVHKVQDKHSSGIVTCDLSQYS